MAGTLTINGQAITVSGHGNTATIPWSDNSFTIGWSGWPTGSSGQIMLQFYDEEYESCFTFSGNTGVSPCFEFVLDFTGDSSSWASYYGYYRAGSSGSLAINSSKDFVGKTIAVFYNNSRDGEDGSCVISFVSPSPTITQQPVLSIDSQSGASVGMSWTAAQVINQGDATIYYQYFVGPSSTYSDSYHIGTTTGLSHTITEDEIISKCGTGFGASANGSTCYLFVRAYWHKPDGTEGGWITPTGVAFTYFPTVNPPTNASLSPARGKQTSVSWTNQLAGNGSQPQAILQILLNGSWQNWIWPITDYYQGYTIAKSVWEIYGKGTYTIRISHEWYGRYANGDSTAFVYQPENTVGIYDSSQNKWVDCVAYMWDGTSWVQCDPYIYDGNLWVLCSTS